MFEIITKFNNLPKFKPLEEGLMELANIFIFTDDYVSQQKNGIGIFLINKKDFETVRKENNIIATIQLNKNNRGKLLIGMLANETFDVQSQQENFRHAFESCVRKAFLRGMRHGIEKCCKKLEKN